MNAKEHLEAVTKISDILEKLEDEDDIYFVMRTIENIYLVESKEDRMAWLFEKALNSFVRTTGNREWIKNHFNFKDS